MAVPAFFDPSLTAVTAFFVSVLTVSATCLAWSLNDPLSVDSLWANSAVLPAMNTAATHNARVFTEVSRGFRLPSRSSAGGLRQGKSGRASVLLRRVLELHNEPAPGPIAS